MSAARSAGYQSADELKLVREVVVFLGDHVTDGCLAQPNVLKVEAELILRRSGITVVERVTGDPARTHLLTIEAFGRQTEGSYDCLAGLQIQLVRFTPMPEGHVAKVTAYEAQSISLTPNKPAMQDQLRSNVSEWITDMANEILKARGQ
jgi:hypothetical protein